MVLNVKADVIHLSFALEFRVLCFYFSYVFFRLIMADIDSLVHPNRTFNSWKDVEDLLLQLKEDFFAPLS